ncbi:Hypothetical predicted protein [Mytilus galloprovincialis]|uniref:Uncharacterized protein n=1 Tax=Mytilus galloprovincialis TaxID=29158 RepID=A0A8B6GSQ6_MYTGA|nr:Hypothetical predicted protein [Mytilus galloprovincialis]
MRVKTTRNMSTTTFSDSDNTSLNVHDLRQEHIEHREVERRIMGLFGGHSDDFGRTCNKRISYELGDSLLVDKRREYLRDPDDKCYEPSTNSSWKEPPNTRRGGFGTTNNYIKDKPPNFDGTSNWQDFLEQFEMVVAVNKWDDNAKAFELATSLRGVAQGVVTEIEPLRRFDYNYLVSSLTSRFEPVNQENMYKVQMNAFYRKPDQTLPEMAQEIRRITRFTYPTAPIDIRNQLGKDCFVRVLNDP